jgi:hypothetical protein
MSSDRAVKREALRYILQIKSHPSIRVIVTLSGDGTRCGSQPITGRLSYVSPMSVAVPLLTSSTAELCYTATNHPTAHSSHPPRPKRFINIPRLLKINSLQANDFKKLCGSF